MVLQPTTAPQVLVKQPSEENEYSMLFDALLSSSETISSVISATADQTGLTISDETIDVTGKIVTVKIVGGTDKFTYRIEILVLTNLNHKVQGDGILKIRDN
jgi:hypothetical protein